MADTPARTDSDPGTRGSLVVKDKVVERLATKAALDTAGVLPHAHGLDKITGRDLPRVRVQISGDRVRAGLDIAARWPTPLTDLTDAVRTNVAQALTDFAGLHVDGIDVAVPAIIVAPPDTRTAQPSAAPPREVDTKDRSTPA